MPIPPLPPWDHNAWYHGLLLRRLPTDCTRVLDVGCGAHVDALDRDPGMIAEVTARATPGVTPYLRDVLVDELPGSGYDAVVSSSTLHHLPLTDALPRLAAALRPGGVLAAVALPRLDLRTEWPRELGALVAENALAATFALTGRFRRESHHDDMPMAEPTLTTAQVRAEASRVLPGVQVRRLTFWRYELLWRRPTG